MPCITKLGQILLILTQSFQKLTSFLIDNIHKYICNVIRWSVVYFSRQWKFLLGTYCAPRRHVPSFV